MRFFEPTTCLLLIAFPVGARTPDRLRPEKGADSEVIVFFGEGFEGDGIFFCVDRSGSMADGELQIAKQELVRSISDLDPRAEFGIVFFDGGVTKFPAPGRPAVASAANKTAAISWVLSTPSGQGQCVGSGLKEALQFANLATARRNLILYLGNGCTACAGNDAFQYAQRTLAEIAALNFERHAIHAITIGGNDEVCEFFPKSLAETNGGTYHRIGDGPATVAFVRGDVDASDLLDLSDPVYLLGHMFLGTAAPPCEKSADLDDNGKLETTDAIYSLHHLFLGGAPPAAPFSSCDDDPTDDELTCRTFPPCAS